ncbi:MAG: flagellar basal body-associated FliL family protein [Methylobacter sp.]|nr:flagellar basal body-associated FliL family protein [Methylobacter sp.]
MSEQKQEGEKSGKSLKSLIIIIVGALVLLAAGAGATFFFMKGSVTHEEKVEVVVEKLYFDMGKPLVINFPKGAMALHGRITLSFLAEGAETIEVLKKNEPMIRNNLLMLIGGQDAAVLNTHEGKETLRKAILDNVNDVLKKMAGKGHQVAEIFFTSFVMQ